MSVIKDRKHAGNLLADILEKDYNPFNTVVLTLPKGGVPVGDVIAEQLKLPLDILLVKKITLPENPEFAIGALAEDEEPIWNDKSTQYYSIGDKRKKDLAFFVRDEINQKSKLWRVEKRPVSLKNKHIILVDDGLATGLTMHAAITFLRNKKVKSITVAVPVASKQAVSLLKHDIDKLVILKTPEPFVSVGQWYQNFEQVSDEEVINTLSGVNGSSSKTMSVKIPLDYEDLNGELFIPSKAKGVIIFAHGSGSTHKSVRNKKVARALNELGFATLLFDLLTKNESHIRANVFDIGLLTKRLKIATDWVQKNKELKALPISYFGASTGAAAALNCAAHDDKISSVICRGGRTDMATSDLSNIQASVLLIVGANDKDVLEINQQSQQQLNFCKLVIIENAGHLFEEPGCLDEVIDYSCNWFLKTMNKNYININFNPQNEIVAEIIEDSWPLQNSKDVKLLLDKVSKSKVVMFGEATHGTEEFYKIRKQLSQKLIEDYNFNFIAVEGNWPECASLNNYIQLRDTGNTAESIMMNFKRWPTWMWANTQTAEFIEWLKGRGVGFYGLDVYSLFESLDRIKHYAERLDPSLKHSIEEAYSCFEFFNRDEYQYAKSLMKWPNGCEKEIVQNLRRILRLNTQTTDLEAFELFDMQQNARVIREAEKYYRAVVNSEDNSWNIRDQHMMESLDQLFNYYGEGAKAIVWAHNTHIGDYHATDMVKQGNINLGGLARERYGMEKVSLVGFGTYQGEVLAAQAWGAEPDIMTIPPAKKHSYEDYFHRAAEKLKTNEYFVLLDQAEALKFTHDHRAIGVVYQSSYERGGRNYVPTQLSNRYDAFVYVDSTSALRRLPTEIQPGRLPETWPVGV